jgi:hypothetical protein
MSGREQAWVGLYRSALLELDLDKLPEKIDAATRAVEARLHELNGDQSLREERHALQMRYAICACCKGARVGVDAAND